MSKSTCWPDRTRARDARLVRRIEAARLTTATLATSMLSLLRTSPFTAVTARRLTTTPGVVGVATTVIVTRSPGWIVPSLQMAGGPGSQAPWLSVNVFVSTTWTGDSTATTSSAAPLPWFSMTTWYVTVWPRRTARGSVVFVTTSCASGACAGGGCGDGSGVGSGDGVIGGEGGAGPTSTTTVAVAG